MRTCGTPAGVIEREGGVLGRTGTSLDPSGLAEPRIRVEVGASEFARATGDALALEPSSETARESVAFGDPPEGVGSCAGGIVGCVTAGGAPVVCALAVFESATDAELDSIEGRSGFGWAWLGLTEVAPLSRASL